MDLIPIIVVCAAICVATVTDLRFLKVYNWLTLPLLALGLGYHTITSGWPGFTGALLNAVVIFAILFIPYMLGAMGAGDLKLVAALAAWLGTSTVFTIVSISLFATGFYSLAMLAQQQRLADAWFNFQMSIFRIRMLAQHMGNDEGERVHEMAKTSEGRARLVPFSVMIAFGTIVTIIWQTCF
ncbi:MAG: hypothetical protein COA78_09205 [Blastopirellula sp.]|nr:MAG: hypothetical protein COA78_09205 [Blastopirellula sp.]